MSLKERLQADLAVALKKREAVKVETIRSVLGEVLRAEKSGKVAVEFDDTAVENKIRQLLKQRREMVTVYAEAGRPESAEKEAAEGDILEIYLPQGLSEDDLRDIIAGEVAKLPEVTSADFGRVMKATVAAVRGRADGKVVSQLVREALAP